jgi:lysophospholipase L1-like esterase
MFITSRRNAVSEAAPAFVSRILLLGDSIARDFRFGAGAGSLLDQVGALSGLAGESLLVNAAFGGYKLMDTAGSDRFLNFTDETEAQGLTDAKSIMATAGPVDAALVSLGVNDLAQVEPAPAAIAGYDAAKVRSGLASLAAGIRAANTANGYAGPTLKLYFLVPGRDHSTGNKAGGGQTWRQGMLDFAAADADVRLIDTYDCDVEDSVHPSAAGFQMIGYRAGRMIAAHTHGAAGVGGPPRIASIARLDDLTIRVNFDIPAGERTTQPAYPAAWRVERVSDGAPLRIARLDWNDANEANLVLHDGAGGAFRLFAPHDLVQGFAPEGVIRTFEEGDAHTPGFALQSFAGETP